MDTKRFEAPALFGDHHVMEVRRILLELGGVSEVYASSAFQTIEVKFDPRKVKVGRIESCLKEAGYLDDLAIPAETGTAVVKTDGDAAFRHTAMYETLKGTVAFAQGVKVGGRAVWPCPGMVAIETKR